MKIRKFISLVMAAVFAAMLIMLPVIASSDDMTVYDIKAVIQGWNGGGTGSLFANVDGKTVTVTGTVTRALQRLEIYIPEDVTVIWSADYSGNTDILNSLTLIRAYGAGTLVISESGSVRNIAVGAAISSWGHVVVSGGIVVSGRSAIGGMRSVTVTSGTVTAADSAIHSSAGDVIINGGTITSQSDLWAIYAFNDIIMTGGTVHAGNFATALHSNGGDITVIGGMILSRWVLINGYNVMLGGDAELTEGGAIYA